jgi:hypothetical protein
MGDCETASSDYCFGGADFMCPAGWKLIGSAGGNHRDTACEPCAINEACYGAITGTSMIACPDGYLCPMYTNSETHHPAQPGSYAIGNSAGNCASN